MAQYNVLANGKFECLTGTGEGNVTLDYEDFLSLYDGNYSSSNVTLLPTDTLYLEIDIGSRLRLDSYAAYINTTSGVLDNINFYYKNYEDEAYTILTKAYNGTFYYASELLPSFSPQKLLFTIAGIDGNLSELVSNNEDYSVSFGEEGNQTVVYINDSDSSNTPDAHVFKIKNTSTVDNVSAYICVDYTGKPEDHYLKVSSDNVNFYGILDGISLSNDLITYNYNWSHGNFDNVSIINKEYLELTDKTAPAVGVYTTPIFCTETANDCGCADNIVNYNRFDSSFIVTTSTIQENTSLKVDLTDQDFTMEVRSSNLDPLNYESIIYVDDLVVVGNDLATCSVYSLDVTTLETTLLIAGLELSTWGSAQPTITNITVNPVNGDIAVSAQVYYNYNYHQTIIIFDVTGTIISEYQQLIGVGSYGAGASDEFTAGGWYCRSVGIGAELRVYDKFLELQYTKTEVTSFSADKLKDSNALWLIETNEHTAIKVDQNGDNAYIVNITSPELITSNFDGGFWVFESSTNTLNKFIQEYDGNNISYSKAITKVLRLDLGQKFSCLSNDKVGKDGVWYCINTTVYHVDGDGNLLTATSVNFEPDSMKTTQLGALVRKFSTKSYSYIDINGHIKQQDTEQFHVTIKGVTFENFLQLDTNLLPFDYDPVWGETAGDLEWRKTTLSGYFLPKTKYHQVRLTLRSDTTGNSPKINSVVIPKPVTVSDIQTGMTKDVYLKTEFTGNEEPYDYNTKLKCWWNIQSD